MSQPQTMHIDAVGQDPFHLSGPAIIHYSPPEYASILR